MKGKKIIKWLIASLALVLVACGQTTDDTSQEDGSLKIVTTFYPMQALTEAVVGDSADVSVMMENTDAHDYEPSAKDIAAVNEADVFIYNSEDMETWVATMLESIDNPDLLVIEAAEDVERIDDEVETIDGEESEEEHDHEEEGHDHSHEVDPHTWLDPVNAITQAKTISAGLTDLNAEDADIYEANLTDFETALTALNDQYQTQFAAADNKTFLTQHAAFGYLANRYDLNQVAVTGLTDSAEPSPQRVAAIVDYIEENNLEAIYTQTGGASDIADTIASEADISVGELQSMETVDTATYPANAEGFIQIMQENLESLSQAIK